MFPLVGILQIFILDVGLVGEGRHKTPRPSLKQDPSERLELREPSFDDEASMFVSPTDCVECVLF